MTSITCTLSIPPNQVIFTTQLSLRQTNTSSCVGVTSCTNWQLVSFKSFKQVLCQRAGNSATGMGGLKRSSLLPV